MLAVLFTTQVVLSLLALTLLLLEQAGLAETRGTEETTEVIQLFLVCRRLAEAAAGTKTILTPVKAVALVAVVRIQQAGLPPGERELPVRGTRVRRALDRLQLQQVQMRLVVAAVLAGPRQPQLTP